VEDAWPARGGMFGVGLHLVSLEGAVSSVTGAVVVVVVVSTVAPARRFLSVPTVATAGLFLAVPTAATAGRFLDVPTAATAGRFLDVLTVATAGRFLAVPIVATAGRFLAVPATVFLAGQAVEGEPAVVLPECGVDARDEELKSTSLAPCGLTVRLAFLASGLLSPSS
jgi:hypothetical protein